MSGGVVGRGGGRLLLLLLLLLTTTTATIVRIFVSIHLYYHYQYHHHREHYKFTATATPTPTAAFSYSSCPAATFCCCYDETTSMVSVAESLAVRFHSLLASAAAISYIRLRSGPCSPRSGRRIGRASRSDPRCLLAMAGDHRLAHHRSKPSTAKMSLRVVLLHTHDCRRKQPNTPSPKKH